MDDRKPVTFVLIHSPLVGPFTWSRVAEALRQRGYEAIVPQLPIGDRDELPYWQRHAEAVAATVGTIPTGRASVLVAHSGAGMLLPAIRQLLVQPPNGYIFADAGIPEDGKSRLDMLKLEVPEAGEGVAMALQAGERIPQWQDDDLSLIVPDAETRRGILAQLQPQGLSFYTEPIPVFEGWPDSPCAYLQFSQGYDYSAWQARALGWPTLNLHTHHFALLTEAPRVTDALLELVATITHRL
jgi:hypothetical protein